MTNLMRFIDMINFIILGIPFYLLQSLNEILVLPFFPPFVCVCVFRMSMFCREWLSVFLIKIILLWS